MFAIIAKSTKYFSIYLHYIKITLIFGESFCDKYVTLYKMAELTPQQIKKLKADKAVKITTQEVVCK